MYICYALSREMCVISKDDFSSSFGKYKWWMLASTWVRTCLSHWMTYFLAKLGIILLSDVTRTLNWGGEGENFDIFCPNVLTTKKGRCFKCFKVCCRMHSPWSNRNPYPPHPQLLTFISDDWCCLYSTESSAVVNSMNVLDPSSGGLSSSAQRYEMLQQQLFSPGQLRVNTDLAPLPNQPNQTGQGPEVLNSGNREVSFFDLFMAKVY